MIHNDRVYGKPLVLYRETRANIEAMTGLDEGSVAYATDTNVFGYDGSTWAWGATVTTHYEPIAFNDEVLIYNHDVLMMEVTN
jgi:hypothetical protein